MGFSRRSHFEVRGDRKLNFGCGWDIRPSSDGWTNLDAFVEHPAVVQHDLTEFPYPFPTNSFDAVFARHVFEHVPLVYPKRNGVATDVLFLVMEELHRILRGGGRLHMLVPLQGTAEERGHPGHYRSFSPETFAFFSQGHGPQEEPSKYQRSDFRVAAIRRNRRAVRHPALLRMGKSQLGIETHLTTRFPGLFARGPLAWLVLGKNQLEAVLVAHKPGPTER